MLCFVRPDRRRLRRKKKRKTARPPLGGVASKRSVRSPPPPPPTPHQQARPASSSHHDTRSLQCSGREQEGWASRRAPSSYTSPASARPLEPRFLRRLAPDDRAPTARASCASARFVVLGGQPRNVGGHPPRGGRQFPRWCKTAPLRRRPQTGAQSPMPSVPRCPARRRAARSPSRGASPGLPRRGWRLPRSTHELR